MGPAPLLGAGPASPPVLPRPSVLARLSIPAWTGTERWATSGGTHSRRYEALEIPETDELRLTM
ncbi:hypothetical protein LY15_001564 [Prauserella flava]|uniref:Uncharacterized protein n=1 Tax=Prauserella sediminis TaxID=577680 RepID=A0A839XJG4_9PSEU|nr:hypothetical protein [Prauserella sediminis]MCR3719603.1 hypothetical protein [Prauserella flava]MCR3735383.1 hypothetical protein [Prauserella salsuginis]